MAIDAGFKLNFGLIVACSGYPHPNWDPREKFSPLIISHGLFDDVVPIDASRTIYEKVKGKTSKFSELSNIFDLIFSLLNIFKIYFDLSMCLGATIIFNLLYLSKNFFIKLINIFSSPTCVLANIKIL